MIFIVHSQINSEKIADHIGLPEYSYYYVLKGFLGVLSELGTVLEVKNPETEVDLLYHHYHGTDSQCIFISFSPPNKSFIDLECPTICVFAWEFDRIPDEVWDDDPKNDWRYVFAKHGMAISLSTYSAAAVKKAMGENFPIAAIPVPVWDNFEKVPLIHSNGEIQNDRKIVFNGNVVDSNNYKITSDTFEILRPTECCQVKRWTGGPIRMGFNLNDESSAFLGGFYQPESWGTWSRIAAPWVLLPYQLSGKVNLKIVACGYGANVNRPVNVSCGGSVKPIDIGNGFTEMKVDFDLPEPVNLIRFSGLDLTPVEGAIDPRSMGIGLRSIEIDGEPEKVDENYLPTDSHAGKAIALDGVVYTSVFNPGDDRKNWTDLVTAFCKAFQDKEDATLVLKMTHHSISSFLGKIHCLLQQMWPFKCRILAIHGYLDDKGYKALVASTNFYVNASRCEGLCLPLMEYMACGIPAISPMHTAMADYIDQTNAFVVKAGLEPGIWPHDPRNIFRALRYRIDWTSLVEAYQLSYKVYKNQREEYRSMGKAASDQIKSFASITVVKDKLDHFFETIFHGK